uniref:Uncharacterized protein n=1 Tax=Romanomermis culicivorax TaxID=13658 RepID=A0A915HP58_ROMCU
MKINLTKEPTKQIHHLKTIALEGDLGRKMEISNIDTEENKKNPRQLIEKEYAFNEKSVVQNIANNDGTVDPAAALDVIISSQAISLVGRV